MTPCKVCEYEFPDGELMAILIRDGDEYEANTEKYICNVCVSVIICESLTIATDCLLEEEPKELINVNQVIQPIASWCRAYAETHRGS